MCCHFFTLVSYGTAYHCLDRVGQRLLYCICTIVFNWSSAESATATVVILRYISVLAGYPASPGWDGGWEGWGGERYAKGEVPSIGAYKRGS